MKQSACVLLSLLLLSACSSPAGVPPAASPSAMGSTPAESAETQALKQELVALLQKTQSGLSEHPEATRLTDEHARQLAANPNQSGFAIQAYDPVPPMALQIRLLQAGVVSSDNLLQLYVTDGEAAGLAQRFGEQLRAALGPGAFTHYGLSVVRSAQGWTASLVLLTEILRFEKVPVRLEQPGPFTLRGSIEAEGFSRPEVLITRPDGQVQTLALTGQADGFVSQLPFEQSGLYSLEVNVTGPFGSQPACNFVVAVGRDYPSPKETGSSSSAVLPSDAGLQLLALVNRDRAAQGQPALKADPLLDQAALSHVDDMLQNGFVGHNSPTIGTPQQQAAQFGITELVAQNLAVSGSLDSAQHELMSSPGHRRSILSPDATHVGFGARLTPDGKIYLAQLFIERHLELERLPVSMPLNQSFQVQGRALAAGHVAAYVGSELQGEPREVKAGERFSLPVRLTQAGKQRLQIGFAPPLVGDSYQFVFYNIWDMLGQP
ncbi:MAG: CAP domain-containing protein [Candidatus Sericytochromatia bacterium]